MHHNGETIDLNKNFMCDAPTVYHEKSVETNNLLLYVCNTETKMQLIDNPN